MEIWSKHLRPLAEAGVVVGGSVGAAALAALQDGTNLVLQSRPWFYEVMHEIGPWGLVGVMAWFLLKVLVKDIKNDLEEALKLLRDLKKENNSNGKI